MIKLDCNWLIDNIKDTEYVPYLDRQINTNYRDCVRVWLMSVDQDTTFGSPFIAKDDSWWYICHLYKNTDKNMYSDYTDCKYSIRMSGTDDGIICVDLEDIDQLYQWFDIFRYNGWNSQYAATYAVDVY